MKDWITKGLCIGMIAGFVLATCALPVHAADKEVPLTTLDGTETTVTFEDGFEEEFGVTLIRCTEDVIPYGFDEVPVLTCDATTADGTEVTVIIRAG